jgi:hypothetical protein
MRNFFNNTNDKLKVDLGTVILTWQLPKVFYSYLTVVEHLPSEILVKTKIILSILGNSQFMIPVIFASYKNKNRKTSTYFLHNCKPLSQGFFIVYTDRKRFSYYHPHPFVPKVIAFRINMPYLDVKISSHCSVFLITA